MGSKRKNDPVWLSGYYPPTMDDWQQWQSEWSMGPHAEEDWVWFEGEYTEEDARKKLAEPKRDS